MARPSDRRAVILFARLHGRLEKEGGEGADARESNRRGTESECTGGGRWGAGRDRVVAACACRP